MAVHKANPLTTKNTGNRNTATVTGKTTKANQTTTAKTATNLTRRNTGNIPRTTPNPTTRKRTLPNTNTNLANPNLTTNLANPNTRTLLRAGRRHLINMNPTGFNPERRYQMICDAAYYRAEHRGFNGGDPMKDWLEAEAEIDTMLMNLGLRR